MWSSGWGGRHNTHAETQPGSNKAGLSVLFTAKALEAICALERGQILWEDKIRAVYLSLSRYVFKTSIIGFQSISLPSPFYVTSFLGLLSCLSVFMICQTDSGLLLE